MNDATSYPDAPIGSVEQMDVKATLARAICLYPGWFPPDTVPEWEGTIEEFWAANEETTWGDIRRMMVDLDADGEYRTGGGAQPCYTIRLKG